MKGYGSSFNWEYREIRHKVTHGKGSMTNINSTTLRFKGKHVICQLLYQTEIKGIAQRNDNYPIKLNTTENYTTWFSTCYNFIYPLILL